MEGKVRCHRWKYHWLDSKPRPVCGLQDEYARCRWLDQGCWCHFLWSLGFMWLYIPPYEPPICITRGSPFSLGSSWSRTIGRHLPLHAPCPPSHCVSSPGPSWFLTLIILPGAFNYLNDVHCLDIDSLTWWKPRIKKNDAMPDGRYGHTATLIGDIMYVFGGQGRESTGGGSSKSTPKAFKDMYALELTTWTWQRVRCATAPPAARSGHSAMLMGDKIVIFGGWDMKRTFSDLWVFDTKAFSWLRPCTTGRPPSPRYGHSCELTDDGRLLVFGGYEVVQVEGAIAPKTQVWSSMSNSLRRACRLPVDLVYRPGLCPVGLCKPLVRCSLTVLHPASASLSTRRCIKPTHLRR